MYIAIFNSKWWLVLIIITSRSEDGYDVLLDGMTVSSVRDQFCCRIYIIISGQSWMLSGIKKETGEMSVLVKTWRRWSYLHQIICTEKDLLRNTNIRSQTKCNVRQGKIRIVVKDIYYEKCCVNGKTWEMAD